jgi:2-polyprenyl-3-methyl-5-hydroxy-6-metoxy-1,4-benzoquinol methylase
MPSFHPRGIYWCGDGLLAVYLKKIKKRTQRIVGVDIDERKIHIANQLDLPEVEFHHQDVADLPSQTFDIVTVVHVMYLIPIELREQFVKHCVRVLKPGGTLVLMINIDAPRWKYYFTHAQEVLMVKLFGLTTGETVQFQSLDECQTWVAKEGAMVSTTKLLGKGRPYSHAAVVAEKLPIRPFPLHLVRTLTAVTLSTVDNTTVPFLPTYGCFQCEPF